MWYPKDCSRSNKLGSRNDCRPIFNQPRGLFVVRKFAPAFGQYEHRQSKPCYGLPFCWPSVVMIVRDMDLHSILNSQSEQVLIRCTFGVIGDMDHFVAVWGNECV